MRLGYVLRRILVFALIIWGAATFTFFLPRFADINPIEERLAQLASRGAASSGNTEATIKNYEKRFGLDRPLGEQYARYLWNTLRFDFGFSIAFFPSQVLDIIGQALPWTVVLLVVVTLMNFTIGILLGAIVSWPAAPKIVRFLAPPVMALSSIPPYLIGIVLIFILAYTLNLLPLSGGYSLGITPSISIAFILDAARHAILPALALILGSIGFWALGMRGMMVTTIGEDYMVFAETKGLRQSRLFLWYGIRNSILPQVTALALSFGHVLSGAILVEVVFGYPGIGGVLIQAIRNFDFTLLYGIVYLTILGIAVATLILDFIYPRIDPRIKYQRA